MARVVRLDRLRTDARLYADQRPAGAAAFIPDAEVTRLINLQLAELYDLLITARGHEYYLLEQTFSTGAPNTLPNKYDLPASFYQEVSLHLEWADDRHELVSPLDHHADRQHFINLPTWGENERKAYRISGSQIELLPTPTTSVTARLRFIPCFTDLVEDSHTFDGVNGWEKLVTLGTALEMCAIRKIKTKDIANLQNLYDRQYARIESMAAERSARAPHRVRDVETQYQDPWWPRPPASGL